MSAFSLPIDIINRAITKFGGQRIDALTDDSANASEANALYDKLRRAELRRNVWRFSIRRTILRAVGTALPDWDETVTYSTGSYVTYSDANWISLQNSNTGHSPPDPDTATSNAWWSIFNGNTSQLVTFSAWASGTTYGQGAIVSGSDSLLYLSLKDSNTAHDPTTDTGASWTLYFGSTLASAYDSTTTYSIGELVFDTGNTPFASTMNDNGNDPADGIGWTQLGGTCAPIVIPWPAGTGPQSEDTSRNIFVLPNGFLRNAPQDPRAGEQSILGYPSNLLPNDWLFEGAYLISRDPGPIMLRFAADVALVSLMDDMFCEGLACRIALELAQRQTQSDTKFQLLAKEYAEFMGEARAINGIETSPTQPYLDDYIATRV